jgi:tetratricopeptide (TPR) repeat protein
MKQLIAVSLLLLMMTPCLMAQKAKGNTARQELSQARSSIKSGNYADAEKRLATLLKDSTNRTNKKIWLAYYDAVLGQYEQGNEKLYLKQKYDTVAFFSKALQLLVIAESIDSLTTDNRKSHSQQLNTLRPNIFNGGSFLLRKNNWAEAYRYYEAYMDCARQPLFQAFRYDSIDARMPEAAYWATYCGYKQENAVLTLRYSNLALQDTAKADFTLQFIAEARKWLKDDELYVKTLEEGFRRYPQFHYFFPRLMDAYAGMGQNDKALALADSALAVNPNSELFLFAKSTTLLRMERYAESIKYSERLIEVNPNLAEPYFNAGTAYINIADRLSDKNDKKLMRQAYQKACPYMEHYRKLMPKEQTKWAPVLYRIYLYLNMGKQFDEIDRLLKAP